MVQNTICKFFILLFGLFFGLHSLLAEGTDRKFTLVVDAGHGGHDSGAVGAYSKEKDINLSVALAFGRLVEANCPDVKVIYTRQRDVFIPLQRRADIANENKADLFLSVHTNALAKGRIAYGSETYSLGMARASENLEVAKRENSVITLEENYRQTYEGFDPGKAESYVIFEIMQDKHMKQSVDLADCIQKQYKSAGRADKGVHQAGFLVLRRTTMPSVLTELGFISTPAEEQYLNSAEGQAELSRSLYNGFLAYRRRHGCAASELPPDLPLKTQQAGQPNPQELAVVPVNAVPTSELPKAASPAPSAKPAAEQPKAPAGKSKQQTVPSKSAPKTETAPSREKSPSAKAKEPARETAKTAKPASAKKENEKKGGVQSGKSKSKAGAVCYRIQVGAGKVEISPRDPQFKGLEINRVKEGSFYKYFHGNYSTYAAAQKSLAVVQKKLPGSYIVAYVNGRPADLKQAREKEKSGK